MADVCSGSLARGHAIRGPIAIVRAGLDDDNGPRCGSAYLFDPTGASSCPWDLDGDDDLRVSDFLLLLASWRSCP